MISTPMGMAAQAPLTDADLLAQQRKSYDLYGMRNNQGYDDALFIFILLSLQNIHHFKLFVLRRSLHIRSFYTTRIAYIWEIFLKRCT